MEPDLTPLNQLVQDDPVIGALAFRESSGIAGAVHESTGEDSRRHVGMVQIGEKRLQDIRRRGGVPEDTTLEDLLADPALQARATLWHVEDLRQQLGKDEFTGLLGQEVNGVPVTATGLLYGAHLAGVGGLRRFLDEGEDARDAEGTRISDYLRLGAQVEASDPNVQRVVSVGTDWNDPQRAIGTLEPNETAEDDPRVVPVSDRVAQEIRGRYGVSEDDADPQTRTEDRSRLVTDYGDIRGSDTNELILELRERNMNQAANFPLRRALREGYDTPDMINALQRRQGMDPRWPQFVEAARDSGFSEDAILAAMIGAEDNKFLAAIEGGLRGGTAAAAGAAGATIGGKLLLGLGVTNPFGIVAGALTLGGAAAIAAYQAGERLVEPTTFSPEALIAHNISETTASVWSTIPAFRTLAMKGAPALREVQIEAAERLAARRGQEFNRDAVEFGRTQRLVDAIARNVGQPGTAQRRWWTGVEAGSGVLAGGAAGVAQAAFPENPWARVALEVGGGFATAPLMALSGSLMNRGMSLLRGRSLQSQQDAAARIAIADHMAAGNALVTPRLFREGMPTGQQEQVLRQINQTLPEGQRLASPQAFMRLSDEAQANILRGPDGEWAYRTHVTMDTFANMPDGVRAEAIEATGRAMLRDMQNMAQRAREMGFSSEAQNFVPESALRLARGIARQDQEFADQLARQRERLMDDMADALRAHYDAFGVGANPRQLQELIELQEELFGLVNQEALRRVDMQLGQVVGDAAADGIESLDALSARFNRVLTEAYTTRYRQAKDVATELYDRVRNDPIDVSEFMRAAEIAPTTGRPAFAPQTDSAVVAAQREAELGEAWQGLFRELEGGQLNLAVRGRQAAAGEAQLGARDMHKLRSLLFEQMQRTLDDRGQGNTLTPYYARMAKAITADLDAADLPDLRTANAFYRSMQETFAEQLGDTLGRYTNRFNPRARNPQTLINAMVPNSGGAGVKQNWDQLNDMLTFFEKQSAVDGLADLARFINRENDATIRDSLYEVSAQLLLERVVRPEARVAGRPVQIGDIDLNQLRTMQRDYAPLIERMPDDLQRTFTRPAEMLPLLNRAKGFIGDLPIGQQGGLSFSFGTDDPAVNRVFGLLSSRGGLIKGPDGQPLPYTEQSGGQFLAWLATPTDALPNRVPAVRDTVRLVNRLADEADKPGGISAGTLERMKNDSRFAEFSEFFDLPEAPTALEGVTSKQIRDGFLRSFGEYGLHYDSTNQPFEELARRVLLPVGANPRRRSQMEALARGQGSEQDSIVRIMQEEGLITETQRRGIEEFLHFGASYEDVLRQAGGADALPFLDQQLQADGFIRVWLQAGGSAIGGSVARMLGDRSR